MIRQRDPAQEILCRAADGLVSRESDTRLRAARSLTGLGEGYWEPAIRARLLVPLRRSASPTAPLRLAAGLVMLAAFAVGGVLGGTGLAFCAAIAALAGVAALVWRRRRRLTERLVAVLEAAGDPLLLPLVLEGLDLALPDRREPLVALAGRFLPAFLTDGRELPGPHRRILLEHVERIAQKPAPPSPDSGDYALLMAAAVCLDGDPSRGIVPDVWCVWALRDLYTRLSPQGRLSVALASLLERLDRS